MAAHACEGSTLARIRCGLVLGERRIWRSCRAAISKELGRKEGVSSILGHEDRMTAFLWNASGRESSA